MSGTSKDRGMDNVRHHRRHTNKLSRMPALEKIDITNPSAQRKNRLMIYQVLCRDASVEAIVGDCSRKAAYTGNIGNGFPH